MRELASNIYQMISRGIASVDGFIWGVPLMVLLVGTGLFLTLLLRVVQMRGFFHAIKVIMGKYDRPDDPGEITHFQALTAALSATIGTGNIVGVAAAVIAGGPGALFWMWITAIVGMATKFTSCTLAVHFRRVDERGEAHGGPMYFIEMGMGRNFKWLAVLFAFFTVVASFGIGNMFQSNSVMESCNALFFGEGSPPSLLFGVTVGAVFAIMTGFVIIGGIKSIARVASFLVPIMCILYLIGGVGVILLNLGEVIPAFKAIFYYAFHAPEAIVGGVLGTVIRQGVARGLFSNEAGLGSAAMAHGAAKTNEPVREGLVAMLGPFIDTLVICSVTGLAIVITGVWEMEGIEKAVATSRAFEIGLGSAWGAKIVLVGIICFAFSTMISWSYYGNRAVEYLLGRRAVRPYQMLFLLFIVLGACVKIKTVINFSDAANGLMAIPNLIALVVLSPLVVKLTRDYFKRMKEGE